MVESLRKYVGGAVVAVGLLVVIAGCGSSNKSSSSGSPNAAAATTQPSSSSGQFAQITAQLDKLQQRPTQIAITQLLKSKPAAGKTIDWLSCGVPACDQKYPPLKAAAAAVGWTVKFVNEGLQPESVKAAWDQALRDNVAAMAVSGGFPTAIFKDELARMKQRGVPIVSYGDAAVSPVPQGLTAEVDGGNRMHNLIGKNFADWVAAKTNGKANVLYAYTSTYPVLVEQSKGYRDEIAQVCPSCNTTYFDAPAASIGKDLASKIASQVQAHPNVNYIITAFSDMAVGVPDALAGVGKTAGKDVKIITQDQNDNTLKDIADGKVEATYVNPTGESMWQVMDVILRSYLKQDITHSIDEGSNTQWWLTKDNVPAGAKGADLSNVADYIAQFKKLWRVG